MKSLFDFSFTKFVTPSIIKILYVLIMVFLAIGYIFMTWAAFKESTGFGIAVLLILGPLGVLIYLALIRAGLESLVAQIRTAENTAELVRLAGGNSSGTKFSNPAPMQPGPTQPGPSAPENPYSN